MNFKSVVIQKFLNSFFGFSRYSYDPFQQSPNECPEAELATNAGDYLLVWGNMDEVIESFVFLVYWMSERNERYALIGG